MADTLYNPEIIIEHFSSFVKTLYQENIMGDTLIRWIDSEFPDGDLLTIPTFSEMEVNQYTEGEELTLTDTDTGKFEFTITEYWQSGFKITDKLKEDSAYMSQFLAHYPQALFRALLEKKELQIFELQSEQTAADPNTINGAAHRQAGGGTAGIATLQDFMKAKYAFTKSDVPRNMWRAVLDPSTTFTLSGIDNVFRQDVYGANSHIKEGISMSDSLGKFMGFDCYESNMLDTDSGSTDIDGTTSVTDPVYNMFCGAGETFVGAMRSNFDFESWRIPERKSDAYSVTTRYGLKLYRPEALFVLGTKSTV